jgi:hypothetical protein
LNLEHEFHHTGSQLYILGFEPLKGGMFIRTASWLPSTLICKAQHILSPVWSSYLVHETRLANYRLDGTRRCEGESVRHCD